MTADQISAMFARRAEAFARRDYVTLAADYSGDCFLASAFAGTVTGRSGVETIYRKWFTTFPDATFQPEDVLIFGDQVVQLGTVRGTDTGGFLGQAPTGKQFSLLTVLVMTLGDQHIVHERRIYDFGGLLLQLAGESSNTVENSRLYQATLDRAMMAHEVSIAAKIQQALLPPARYVGTGFEVAAASMPCRAIGGDFFDYFELSSGEFGFVLGDVSGKGPPAALLAAVLQGIFAGHSHSGGTPAETLAHANDVLVRRAIESRFATVLYGVLSCDGRLTYSNAGHNPPLLIGRRGVRRLDKGGLILGPFKTAKFEDETLQLEPGDLLLVFTDGVTEAEDTAGREFGEEQLLSFVKAHRELPPGALLECLFDCVHAFSGGLPQRDDVTLFVLQWTDLQNTAA